MFRWSPPPRVCTRTHTHAREHSSAVPHSSFQTFSFLPYLNNTRKSLYFIHIWVQLCRTRLEFYRGCHRCLGESEPGACVNACVRELMRARVCMRVCVPPCRHTYKTRSVALCCLITPLLWSRRRAGVLVVAGVAHRARGEHSVTHR